MQLPRSPETAERARLFAALADATRLEIVRLLADDAELSASQIANRCGVSLALACHHVKVLTDAGIVSRKKVGLRTHYALVPTTLAAAFDTTLRTTLPAPQLRPATGGLRVLSAYPVA